MARLNLVRAEGDGFTLGESLHISVLEIIGRRVVLAIDAPRSVPITRDELTPAEKEAYRARAAAEGA